ncbi:MAG: hypothetical protein ABIF09_06345 [Gemmatimonadota bacterium]
MTDWDATGVPRLVGIEHPFGQRVGQPGDDVGQMALLRAPFKSLQEMKAPGSVEHLPFKWPETKRIAQSHSVQLLPIAVHLQRHPWHFPRLLSRDVPR